jgi:hypothetical protein
MENLVAQFPKLSEAFVPVRAIGIVEQLSQRLQRPQCLFIHHARHYGANCLTDG